MTDLDVRTALTRATDHLDPPPDFLEQVRAGGRRRVVRRRSVLAAAVATVAAGSTTWAATRRPEPGPPAADRLTGPTRGDLAGDTAFLAQVAAFWRQYSAVPGEPHVAWAGTTPAGPVALIGQPAITTNEREYGITGFVVTTGAGLRFGGMEAMLTGIPNRPAVLVGERSDTLLVLDDGRPIELSRDFGYTADGKVDRRFERLRYDDRGAAVVRLAPQPEGRVRIALRAGSDRVDLAGRFQLVYEQTEAPAVLTVDKAWDLRLDPAYNDPYGLHAEPARKAWYLNGRTPDGAVWTVQTLVLDDEVRTFSGLNADPPVYLGMRRSGEMPSGVQVRLPGGRGVVVADEADELAYRATGGDWLPVSGTVALIPATATELRVTRAGRKAVVALPA